MAIQKVDQPTLACPEGRIGRKGESLLLKQSATDTNLFRALFTNPGDEFLIEVSILQSILQRMGVGVGVGVGLGVGVGVGVENRWVREWRSIFNLLARMTFYYRWPSITGWPSIFQPPR